MVPLAVTFANTKCAFANSGLSDMTKLKGVKINPQNKG